VHAEEELARLLRQMLPEGSCELVLPPLLAICRGRESGPDVAHMHGFLGPGEPIGNMSDPDHPYYWDAYYADD